MPGDVNLQALEGETLLGARRLVYLVRGQVRDPPGGCELTFSNSGPLVVICRGDGETLYVTKGQWVDPFAEPLSEENRAWVHQAGKWTALSASDRPPFAALVGRLVEEVTTTHSGREQKLVAVQLRAGGDMLTIRAESDGVEIS